MSRKLGEVLADMVLYGDLDETPWPDGWCDMKTYQSLPQTDPELFWRQNIAATLLKLTNGGMGGSCSSDDKVVTPFLTQIVDEQEM